MRNEKRQIRSGGAADAAPVHATDPDLDGHTADLLGCVPIKKRHPQRVDEELERFPRLGRDSERLR